MHLDVLCDGLHGLQRAACITGAALIGPADPEQQLELCAQFDDARDAVACIRGTKTQNLLGAATAAYVRLLGRCELFAGGTVTACYRWPGWRWPCSRTGGSSVTGCPALPSAPARTACGAGAREREGPLVTFS